MENKPWKSLRPLRIPPGWEIIWNKLEDLEPEALSADDPAWLRHFTEDILALRTLRSRRWHKQPQVQSLVIDLGWYPDGDPAGAYTLQAILDGRTPLLEFRSRSTRAVVDTMEYWLFRVMLESWVEDAEGFRKKWGAGRAGPEREL